MLLIIKFLAKILSVLNGEISPKQIAAGFAWGVLLGLIPLKGLLATLLLIVGFVVNINLTIMFVAAAIFKIFAYGVDPIANQIGFHLLTKVDGLHGLWTQLYNMPLVPYTKFNNTIVLGSFVIGLILLLPMYVAAHWGIVAYRKTLREKVQNWKITKVIQASTFYKYYVSFRGLTGE
jgi:uncharacterized protein (TIGR03546 family)